MTDLTDLSIKIDLSIGTLYAGNTPFRFNEAFYSATSQIVDNDLVI